MRKRILIVMTGALLILSSGGVVFAQTANLHDQIGQKAYGQVSELTLSQTVGKIIRIVLGLLGIIFLALTVYAGFLWMTAAGNDEQAGKAIGILKTGVIGLIIILASYSITYFVLDQVFKATVQ